MNAEPDPSEPPRPAPDRPRPLGDSLLSALEESLGVVLTGAAGAVPFLATCAPTGAVIVAISGFKPRPRGEGPYPPLALGLAVLVGLAAAHLAGRGVERWLARRSRRGIDPRPAA